MMRVFFLSILCFVLSLSAHAQEKVKPDLESFGAWPVLHDGRTKTMESFSRAVFYTIAGETEFNGITATAWMANTLFDPSSSINVPIFKISRHGLLDLPNREDARYTMNEVMTALQPHQDLLIALEQKNPATLNASQKDLLKLYEAVSIYNQVIQSFSAVLPLHGHDQPFIDGGGGAAQRALIQEGGMDNTLVRIIPNDSPSVPMVSMWQAIQSDIETPVIENIKIMAAAWNEGDYATWNERAKIVQTTLNTHHGSPVLLKLEHYYVMINPMAWAIGFYLVGTGLFFMKQNLLATVVLSTGFALHLGALVTRSIILARPPTGTLYETLLFGAAIIMLVGLMTIFKNKNHSLFLMICAISAAFILFISRGFIGGDSLNVLIAVLNTNFWLSTHVTVIIIGYGFCIMAAMVAHGVLAVDNPFLEKLMVPLTLAALLFTSIGTLLGGIWADQSWGRFWGWDPKENGALLIVLWLAWVLHGRISGHFKPRGFAAALALTNIMVALTWFGVNLLGVGLHSYGFIDGIAWGLGSFIVIQMMVVAFLYYRYPKVRHG
jgi:ABC-type transport system involved in cytochrome c biogenesis permease subunit